MDGAFVIPANDGISHSGDISGRPGLGFNANAGTYSNNPMSGHADAGEIRPYNVKLLPIICYLETLPEASIQDGFMVVIQLEHLSVMALAVPYENIGQTATQVKILLLTPLVSSLQQQRIALIICPFYP